VSNPSATPDEIAKQFQAAHDDGPVAACELMVSLMAPEVEVRHDPPVDFDTTHPREMLGAHRANEIAALSKALTDYQEIATVSARGDEVVVDKTVSGTFPGGETVSATYELVYTIHDGQIVAALGNMDPGAGDAMRRMLEAGGFTAASS
jgi:hypothetical protein